MDKNQPLKQVHIDVLRAIRDNKAYSPAEIGRQLDLDPDRVGQIAHIFLYRRGLVDCEWYRYKYQMRRVSGSTYITKAGLEYLESKKLQKTEC